MLFSCAPDFAPWTAHRFNAMSFQEKDLRTTNISCIDFSYPPPVAVVPVVPLRWKSSGKAPLPIGIYGQRKCPRTNRLLHIWFLFRVRAARWWSALSNTELLPQLIELGAGLTNRSSSVSLFHRLIGSVPLLTFRATFGATSSARLSTWQSDDRDKARGHSGTGKKTSLPDKAKTLSQLHAAAETRCHVAVVSLLTLVLSCSGLYLFDASKHQRFRSVGALKEMNSDANLSPIRSMSRTRTHYSGSKTPNYYENYSACFMCLLDSVQPGSQVYAL